VQDKKSKPDRKENYPNYVKIEINFSDFTELFVILAIPK